MTLNLGPDDESQLLGAIRRVPESYQDVAFAYAADRLRAVREPSVFDVNDICGEIITRYGGRE